MTPHKLLGVNDKKFNIYFNMDCVDFKGLKYVMSNKYNIFTLCTLDHAMKNEEFAVVMVAENAVSLCCLFSMICLSLTLKLCCI